MPADDLLDLLSDELIDQVGQHALARHLPSALRFGETCKGLRTKLEAVLSAAAARRLQWLPEPTTFHVIYDQGRSLTRPLHSVGGCVDTHRPSGPPYGLLVHTVQPKGLGQLAPRVPASGAPYVPHMYTVAPQVGAGWAVGSLLPSVGISSWSLRVEHSSCNAGMIVIGVCDAAVRCSWGLRLVDGRMDRYSRDDDGQPLPEGTTPPSGFPDGIDTMDDSLTDSDTSRHPADLEGRAQGALVDVTVDHDAGTLGYSINGGPHFETLRGFPPAAALRLWAKLTSARFTGPGAARRNAEERSDDLISLVSAWV